MKKLIIVIMAVMLIGGCIPWDIYRNMVEAADPCEYAKSTYIVCAGEVDGEMFYVVHSFPCEKMEWYVLDFIQGRTLEQAKMGRDLRNASAYSTCQTDRRYEAAKREWNKIQWTESK